MNNHHKYINNILENKDNKGNIILRESSNIEYKENFNYQNISRYLKVMASFANRSGGYIIFGIKDSPRSIIGISYDKFNDISQENITSSLIEYFIPEIKWDIDTIKHNGVYLGYIYTYEAESKPIICKKNKDNIIKNGEIYYRYRAQTRNIEYGELKKIIDKIKGKENLNWINILKKLVKYGPGNITISDNKSLNINLSSKKQALPVSVKEDDFRKFYIYDYAGLIYELKQRYSNFKSDNEFRKLMKKLKSNSQYCFIHSLDPLKPKSATKCFYSKEIFKEFDKHYTLR